MGLELSYNIKTALHYLARDPIYQFEKPYLVAKDVDISNVPGAVETNRILEKCPVEVCDVRTCPEQALGLDITGWTFIKGETSMSTADFYDAPTVETIYFDELQRILKKEFPQYTKVAFLDYIVRKRSPKFPHEIGATTEAEQPLSLTHSDFSTEGGLSRVDIYVKDDPKLEGVSFDMLNMWRLIRRGPNNDWPLGLCDYRSVDVDNDPIDNDVIFNKGGTENTLLYFNPKHQWYWKSNMDMDDIIVLRNAGSPGREAPRAFHGSFEVPDDANFGQNQLRESIEVRLVAFL